jgi:hypothetical protein
MYMNMIDAERRLDAIRQRANAEAAAASEARAEALAKPGRKTPRYSSYETGADASDPQRRSRRIGIDGEVLVRRLGSFNFQAELEDVSTGGCRVRMIEECEVDEPLVTRFPQLEPLGARVCWAQGMNAGLAFSTSLHPAVFDALLGRLGAPANCNDDESPADEA